MALSRAKIGSMTKYPYYSVVIPAFNESARIPATLEEVVACIRAREWDAEVIVVDDGSGDNTAQVVLDFANSAPEVRLIQNRQNRGKGYSVRNGMLNARGDILLFSDADFSSPIYEAVKLIGAINDGAEVAFGSRWLLAETQTKRQSRLRQFVGRAYNLLLRVALGLPYKDTQCGFKAFTRKAAEVIFTRQQIEGWGFDPEILFIARKFGIALQEVAVEWANDDRSKINPITDGVKMFWELLRIRYYGMTGQYARPTFQFFASTPGTVIVDGKRPA